MLAELSLALGAIKTINSVISEGRDLYQAASSIGKLVGAEEELQRKVAGKDKSKLGGSDLEAFLALEKIREEQQNIKRLMIYTGRPGLYQDYQRFLAKTRRERREAEKAAAKRKKKILFNIALGALGIFFIGLIGLIIFIVYMAAQQ